MLSMDGKVPGGAFSGGQEANGEKLFLGRIYVGGGWIFGKINLAHGSIYVSYGGVEEASKLASSKYEALVRTLTDSGRNLLYLMILILRKFM